MTSCGTNLGCNYEEKGSLLSIATCNTSTSLKRKRSCSTLVPLVPLLSLPLGERVHQPSILEQKEEEEISRLRISLELSLRHEPPWKITEKLVKSDLGRNSRLLIPKKDAMTHIMPFMDCKSKEAIVREDGMVVIIEDINKNTKHNLVFKYLCCLDGYILKKAWKKEFVRRRQLQVGNEVGLLWDDRSHKFYFSVIHRAVGQHPQT